MDGPSFDIAPAPFEPVYRLVCELGLDWLSAQTLVRRGLEDPRAVREFLDADEEHPPSAFRGIDAACELIERHIAQGSPIVVHGDYDADGACSTAILIGALRELGADPSWFIPGRREDGYGLSAASVDRLASDGAGLLITADCAITAVDEVALARSRGVDVVVTDHHRERADGRLPDAPIVHPRACGYPFEELCAAAVAAKLAARLRERSGRDRFREGEAELVAIATIADCVPLVGENRRLVVQGLRALATTKLPGLRALMRVAGAEPGAVDEQTVGFRLAPRINAAGRVGRADPAVELLLASDEEAAQRCADELDRLNAERRHVETRIRFEAESMIAAAGPQPGYVLAATDWHPGVIGITASRIAERHGRPVLLVALDGETGTGSGRSIPGFDLLGALDRCAPVLERHGGHKAAAGCTVKASRVEELRAAFTEACREALGDGEPARSIAIDAVSSPGGMTLEAATALNRLRPFGVGNPSPMVLLPGVQASDARAMGEGRHMRCSLEAGGRRASAVAFGRSSLPGWAEGPADVACRLEVNRWKGREEPRVLIEELAPAALGPGNVIGQPEDHAEALVASIRGFEPHAPETAAGDAGRMAVDRQGEDPLSVIAGLAFDGETAVVARDAHRLRRRLGAAALGLPIVAWSAWRADRSMTDGFTHLVIADPPLGQDDENLLRAGREGQFSHLAWGEAELRSTIDELRREQDLRSAMVAVYRAALRHPQAPVAELFGSIEPEISQEHAALVANVFAELGLAEVDPAGRLVLREGASADLDGSQLGKRHATTVQERLRWLNARRSLAA